MSEDYPICDNCGENVNGELFTCFECGNTICDVCANICKNCDETFCDSCYAFHKKSCR
jgi:hypothetical protein